MADKSNNKNNDTNNHCTSPEEIFSIATSLAILFSSNLTKKQLLTLINLIDLLQDELSAIVTQMEICEGDIVQPPNLQPFE